MHQNENQNVLVKKDEIKERWRSYFDKPFNESLVKDLGWNASSTKNISGIKKIEENKNKKSGWN